MAGPFFIQLSTIVAVQFLVIIGFLIVWGLSSMQRQSRKSSDLKESTSDGEIHSQQESLKSKVIRISRIPKTIGPVELHALLEDLSVSSLTQNQGHKDSGVPEFNISFAPVDSKYSQAIVRTTSGFEIPRAETLMGPLGYELCIDDHFNGMTVLHASDAANAADDTLVDIILVHGLGGHAIESWKPRTSLKFWALDFLREDVENVRIMTYGYDTRLDIHSNNDHHGKKSIKSLAKSMLEEICTMRCNEASQNRPIIFLGHSLGGLVIKEALITASRSKSYKPWLQILESCRSLIFFGVPNLGMSFEELSRTVDGRESEQLVRDLLVDKDNDPRPLLQGLTEEFVECIQGLRDLEIVCYYETKLSPPIIKENTTTCSRGTLIVNKASATYTGLSVKSYNILELEGDHRSMVKFLTRSNLGYRSICSRLNQVISQVMESREREKAESVIASTKLLPEDEACLRSLAFAEMYYRRQQVDDAHPNTCGWILKHPHYIAWKFQDRGLLWIKGKPGSGKSTLMAFLYTQLYQTPPTKGDLRLDFFFHARGVELQYTMIGMLQSLLHQLYTQTCSVRQRILYSFREKKMLGEAGKDWHWQLKELEKLFLYAVSSIDNSQRIIIFVDALDEAGEQSARELALYFHRLNDQVTQSDSNVRICFSCRHYPVTATMPGLEIVVEDYNGDDISIYIRDTLYTCTQLEQHTSRSVALEEIRSQITQKASGVFQWARLILPLVIGRIHDGESTENILETLANAPEELKGLYMHILKNVIKRDYRPQSLLLMQWIHLAEKPLSLTELRFAMISCDIEIQNARIPPIYVTGFVESDDLMEKRTASLSGGLVEVKHQEDGNTVQFVHQSVNDFLRLHGLDFFTSGTDNLLDTSATLEKASNKAIGGSQDRLSRLCISYLKVEELLRTELTDEYTDEDLQRRSSFLKYVSRNWFKHSAKAESNGFCQVYLVEEFNSPQRQLIIAWIKYHRSFERGIHVVSRMFGLSSESCPEDGSTILHFASALNILSVVQYLLDTGTDPNEADVTGSRPLHFAARWGFKKMVTILLENGAEIDAGDRNQTTALEFAVEFGFQEIVVLLLNSGAKINQRSSISDNALQKASYHGSMSQVRLLLQNGADVNIQRGYFGYALQAASCNGSLAIVQLLIQDGADINAQGGEFGNALQAASFKGNKPIVELLLSKGAKINVSCGGCGSALQAASFEGHETIVRLLLENGAYANQKAEACDILDSGSKERHLVKTALRGLRNFARGGDFSNALQAASFQGHTTIVKLLLESGADANLKGGEFGNALHAASVQGHEEIVKLLIEAQANVNAQGGECGNEFGIIYQDSWLSMSAADGCFENALQAASFQGYKNIVQLLIEKGAYVDAHGGICGTALQAAAGQGNITIVQLLLEKGANVNAKGGEYDNALQTAAFQQQEAVIQLLLENGADVNMQGGYYGNALQAASCSELDEIKIVQLLLDNGANINAQGGIHGSALQAASEYGCENIVHVLLENNADVNAQGGKHGNALQAASRRGSTEVVLALLEYDVDVNAQEGKYGSALYAASWTGHMTTVLLLYKSGANINALGGKYGTALQAVASVRGHEGFVKFLIRIGCDVNIQGGYYGNALQAASARGSKEIVKYLVKIGGDVNAQGGYYGNALQAASARGRKEIVKYLIKNGADINAKGGYYGSALGAALSGYHEGVTRILLGKGAVLNIQDKLCWQEDNA